ncbi:MAG: LAGLIDADG family homing endonuclease [Candidatus Methylomirabilaceae bacterium]
MQRAANPGLDAPTPIIESEIGVAAASELQAYLQGASRDGTLSRLHQTLRIAQADVAWLHLLQNLLSRLNRKSWIYREGRRRDVWVIETTWQPESPDELRTPGEAAAFVRGYFDAEGGVPLRAEDRFYIQFVQKDRADLARPRASLESLGIRCGRIHTPSVQVAPDYWRFYVFTTSHADFARIVGSWHPRKRALLEERFRR